MNVHSKNESTKTQVSEAFFWKKHRNSFLVEKRKKYSLWKLPSSISLTIYSVLTIIKPRESAGMGWIHMQYISACQGAEPLIERTWVEDFFCSSYSFAMNGQERTCLVNCSSNKRFYISIYSKWLAPGISLLDNIAVNAINWMVIQPHPGPSSFKWLSCFSPSFRSMNLNWLIPQDCFPKDPGSLGQYQSQDLETSVSSLFWDRLQ